MSDELFTEFVVVFDIPNTKLDRSTFTEFLTHYPSLFVLLLHST